MKKRKNDTHQKKQPRTHAEKLFQPNEKKKRDREKERQIDKSHG